MSETAAVLAKQNEKINALEQALVDNLPAVECPLIHRFTPGLYAREIFMPAGTIITSKIHKTEHPFVILSGRVRVWTDEDGDVELVGPHVGITKPGTRRVLAILEDTRWITFHPSEETELVALERELIEPHDIPVPIDVIEQLQRALPNPVSGDIQCSE